MSMQLLKFFSVLCLLQVDCKVRGYARLASKSVRTIELKNVNKKLIKHHLLR